MALQRQVELTWYAALLQAIDCYIILESGDCAHDSHSSGLSGITGTG